MRETSCLPTSRACFIDMLQRWRHLVCCLCLCTCIHIHLYLFNMYFLYMVCGNAMQTPWKLLAPRLLGLGFQPGWGSDAGIVKEVRWPPHTPLHLDTWH